MKKQKKKKNIFSYVLFWLLYCILLLGIFFGIIKIWLYVWKAAEDFQKTRPESLMEDAAVKLAGEGAIFKKNYEKEGLFYTVYTKEGDDVADVEVLEKEETGFLGFTLYELGEKYGRKAAAACALEGLDVFFDGVLMKPVGSMDLKELEGLEDFAVLPKISSYEAEGYFAVPSIKINGESVQSEDKSFYAFPIEEKEKAEIEKTAVAFLKDYSYYLIGELSWDKMSQYLFKDTPLYKSLKSLSTSWYTNYVKSSFGEINLDNLICYSDKLYSFTTSFNYSVQGKWKTSEYNIDVKCYILKSNDKWKILQMQNN